MYDPMSVRSGRAMTMDVGELSFGGLVGSGLASLGHGGGSGLIKEKRSGPVEDDWRCLKMVESDDFGANKEMLLQLKSPLFRSNSFQQQQQQQQQMISFSMPSSGAVLSTNGGAERSYQNPILHCYHSPAPFSRTSGLGCGSSTGSMHGGLSTAMKGPFTPSQWMELEHQALIFKYLNLNIPIPSNLLIPLKRTLSPSGLVGFSSGPLNPNTLGWGSFHLGRSGNTDPEPGRCRRTDGKKWRCSRDAVADQKYCERHMNRGRHRSRKPVEGQTGPASGTTTKNTMIGSSPASLVPQSGALSSINLAQQQIKTLQHPVDSMNINRILENKPDIVNQIQDLHGLSPSTSVNPKTKDGDPNLGQQIPFGESSGRDFGLIPSDFFLNPQRSNYIDRGNISSSPVLKDRDSQESHALHHFIDWPKNQSEHLDITWPDVEEIQSDKIKLSISNAVPVPGDELSLSPPSIPCELNPIQMSLSVGGVLNEATQGSVPWEAPMGGPLGEVLNNTRGKPSDYKNSSSALNLTFEGWDASPQMGTSPTGVLHKPTYGSLSNTSAGSSPMAENGKTQDHISSCGELLGSTLVDSSVPSM